jgi:predicted GNAT family acetyltransferase
MSARTIRLVGDAPAARAFVAIERTLEGADDLRVAGDTETGAAMIVAHGARADALIVALAEPPAGLLHLALVHPRDPHLPTSAALDGLSVLITAGATDPETPADRIGTLADAFDAAGANTEVHWNRGAGEITDEEITRLTLWVNAARGAMVDVATLPIAREEHDGKGRYLIAAPGGATAEMSYSRVNDGLIIIDHTEVPDAFRGTGTGRRLLERLIADARAAGTRIVPLCPFAKAQFDRHPEWADLLETRLRVKPKPAR